MLNRKDLFVNREYQRGARLWPAGPRSYFIDTILTGYPFPKLYFYEYLDKTSKKTRREIVDGQQRISAILDFLDGKYALTSVTGDFEGKKFPELPEESQDEFLEYAVQVDVIRNAEKSEILEMFRRMNAYTLPLNDAEKRHSGYQGVFKWLINEVAVEWTSVFIEFGIFSNRQIVRMADAELLAEMVVFLEKGIISTSSKILTDTYKRFDEEFPQMDEYFTQIDSFLNFLVNEFGELRKTYLMKPYVIHSLFSACVINSGRVSSEKLLEGIVPDGRFTLNVDQAIENLRTLAMAHESKEVEGDYAEYIWGCSGGTNREPRRTARVRWLLRALRCEM